MNERIIEMAIQAGFNPVNCTGSNVPLFEKFSELIVRECALTLYKTSMNNHESGFAHEARVMELAGDMIKQHFGVE
jgi:hypothetical protein